MKRCSSLMAIILCTAAPVAAADHSSVWTAPQIARLRVWIRAAPDDALPMLSTEVLDRADAARDAAAIQDAADELALRLGHMHLQGFTPEADHMAWRVQGDDDGYDLAKFLLSKLAANDVDGFFANLVPRHPDYMRLRDAYRTEADSKRKLTLARNMERWRWMPLALGDDFLLVNTAEYQVARWQAGSITGRWPVIVGKPKTPTPVFTATVTGVTFNPWWDVPQSIVKESVGALVRRNPAAARSRGFVWANGGYRQRPGPTNALGQMKLVMPNRYNVYLHDTPNRELFAKLTRAFSHGCIRVGDALSFASDLLGKSKAEAKAIVSHGKTETVPLPRPIPVYITYFTATVGSDGRVAFHPDHYGRDAKMGDAKELTQPCPA